MVEYGIAKTEDKAEVIDFINYVFSQSSVPHDFKKLMPKLYADRIEGLKAKHYIVKKDKKIQALIADSMIDVSVHGHIQRWGMIGNVSVHPYARGEGFMKDLMQQVMEDAKRSGVDILVLNGQRQRYGYFGFENAGIDVRFMINKKNINHCLSKTDTSQITFAPIECATEDEILKAKELHERKEIHALRAKEDFLEILHNWNRDAFLIYKDKKMAGYVCGGMSEVVLEDEKDFAAVLKNFFEMQKISEAVISTTPFEKERAGFLSKICEQCYIEKTEMIKILNWKNVLSAFLELKSQFTALMDGKIEIMIGKEGYQISVTNGKISVEQKKEVGENAVFLTEKEAQQKFFGTDSLVFPDDRFKNWFPLPFSIDQADAC